LSFDQPLPQESSRPRRRHARRNAVIGAALIVVVILVASLSFGSFANKTSASSVTVNSPSNPVSGAQLFAAYTSNLSVANATYTQKMVYIQDVIDPGDVGAVIDANMGRYFSTVDFGTVVLYWSHDSQALALTPGQKFLAQCDVNGMGTSVSGDYLLYLMDCQLVTSGQSA
jgi:hypothetical protein